MPDPYTFPPGDVRPDDPAKPGAAPLGGEQGSNEHGEGSEFVATSPGGAQGGGFVMGTPGALPDEDPELSHNVLEPSITGVTPALGIHVGTVITVAGHGLGDVSTATVDGVTVDPTTITATDTSVTLTVPAGATGAAAVVLSSDSHGLLTTNITVTLASTAVSYSPSTVHVGTTVTVTGTNLSDVTAVKVGNVAATSVVAGATTVAFVVGVGTPLAADATVLTSTSNGAINGPAITVS